MIRRFLDQTKCCILGTIVLYAVLWIILQPQRISSPMSTCPIDDSTFEEVDIPPEHEREVTRDMKDRSLLLQRVKEQVGEMWRATKYEVEQITMKSNDSEMALKRLKDRYHSLMIDVEELTEFDRPWQMELAQKTKDKLVKKMMNLQYPDNCDTKGQLYIPVTECGFGCSFRHLARCMEHSMAHNMVLIADYNRSIYKVNKAKHEVFPFEETSSCSQPTDLSNWTEFICQVSQCAPKNADKGTSRNMSDYKHVFVTEEFLPSAIGFKPPGVSDEMWSTISSFHGNPRAWWNGVILGFLTLPREELQMDIFDLMNLMDFTKPVVGVHIRRSDKLTLPGEDAIAHDLHEYMKHAADWFDKYEMKLIKENKTGDGKRRVYLATDEPSIWNETSKYPDYIFLGEKSYSKSASDMNVRESLLGLKTVVTDVVILSKCDFIVGTMTSSVTLLAYELHQNEVFDGSGDFVSLDIDYGNVNYPNKIHVAVLPHVANLSTSEIELKPGDIIYTDTNLWNGYYSGINSRTRERGFYPTYKVKNSPVYYSDLDKNMFEIFQFHVAEDDYGNLIPSILKVE